MSEIGITIEDLLENLWIELFNAISEYAKIGEYDDLINLKDELLDGGEAESFSKPGLKVIFKFNKLAFICTQIVDYNNILYNKFKNHFDKFGIKMLNKDYTLRYRNPIGLAREIFNHVNFKMDLSDVEYWNGFFMTVTDELNKTRSIMESEYITRCENQLKIIHKLDGIIRTIQKKSKEYDDSTIKNYIDFTMYLDDCSYVVSSSQVRRNDEDYAGNVIEENQEKSNIEESNVD
uniref:p8b n=1 Tax=Emaravirus idaeobati TaxID=1980431 RepID=A0A0K1LHT1_9VIRU|nr:P8b [Emaravirus idaeobati]